MVGDGMLWWRLGAVLGGVAVALGAFGAHGLQARVDAQALGWWETAARYHLAHALALLAVAAHPAAPRHAGWLFVAGILLFSGSLYAMTLTGARGLGAITPLGGLCLIAGWLALALARPPGP
jgi:uncharacterized membrane protein YgdD (TMEM256/DUF423 family)